MEIRFGWGADAASWADASTGVAGTARTGAVRMGPRGLVRLLRTRLGLTRPDVEHAVRIAQYAELAARADHPWHRDASRLDRWATARHLLALRDELVLAGWEPTRLGDDAPPRLAALAAIEAQVRAQGQGSLALPPGPADDLAEVRAVLAGLDADGATWPLGISAIACEERPADLPGVWPEVLDLLGRLGVAVEGPGTALDPAEPPRLHLVTASDEWAAAEAAARFLAERGEGAQVLAGTDTIVLDQELRRRALPAVGVVPPSPDRSPQQVLGLFLALAIAPVDVRELAALLDLRLADAPPRPDGEDPSDADGSGMGARPLAEPLGLVPPRVRRTLLHALADEPGIGGEKWSTAIAELAAGREADREAALAIDELVRAPLDPRAVLPAALLARTDWLVRRLRAVDRGTGLLAATIAPLTTFRAVLAVLPSTPLGARDLEQIVASCGGAAASPLARPEAAPWTVATSPAHLAAAPGGTVLWWGCVEEPPRRATVWDAEEARALVGAGARLTDPEALAALETAAALRGLARAREVIAIRPTRRRGAAVQAHSLLSHLIVPAAGQTVQDAIEGATVGAADLIDGGRWRLAGAERALRPSGLAPRPVEPTTLTRSTVPGTRLLRDRLSFSQVENLLGCHQKWLYRSALHLRPADVATVSTGNRMIGTLVHKAVEDLVGPGAPAHVGGVPSADAIRRVLDGLVPRHASELLLPGRESELAQLRARVIRSLTTFFTALAEAGLRVVDTEATFERDLHLPLASGERTITFTGSRDIDAADGDGRPVVIDLKWTNDRGRYGRSYDAGEAIQLAAYAWSVEPHGTAVVPPPPPARVGYFLLKQGEFVAADPALDPTGRTELDVRDVFDRMSVELTAAFDEIAAGTVTAVSGDLRRKHDLPLHPDREDLDKATVATKEAALARGGIWIDATCGYCDFSLLCGLRGDRS